MNKKYKIFSSILALILVFTMGIGSFAQQNSDPFTRLREMVIEDQELVETDNLIDLDEEVLYIVEIEEKALKDYVDNIEEGAKDEKLTKKLIDSQQSYKKEILNIYPKARFENEYSILLNGFSVIARRRDQEAIENIKGVKHVSISKEYERDMSHAIDLGEVKEVYEDLGYEGEGMLVSIIDSGIDYRHKDMVLSEKGKKELKLDRAEVDTLVKNNGFVGKYFTEKIPYGCNYIDEDKHAIVDKAIGNVGYMHGMHVAGIVGANCQSEEEILAGNGIRGVAPEAQLLAMKIFSNDPQMNNAREADVISAIEDSVALGADVINMSISGSAGFQNPEDGQQKAIREAVERGVLVIVAGGNAYYSTYPNKYPEIGDTSTIGAPGITEDALQVASMDNKFRTYFVMNASIDREEIKIPYGMTDFDIKSLKNNYKLVDCGLGLEDKDFPSNLKGNIALIKRGGGDFSVKKINAQNKGALGVIIYNQDGDEEILDSTYYDKEVLIPSIFIRNSDGIKLKEAIDKDLTISFPNEKLESEGEDGMSIFSSWGPAPNLNLKPDLTGLGGSIWSTVNNDSYKNMSGTSMATPYVAGLSALLKQHYQKEDISLENKDWADFNKINLMNTAKVQKNNNLEISPRKQGAGLVSGKNAINNKVKLTYKGKASASLKEISKTNTINLKVENLGGENLKFKLRPGQVLMDGEKGEGELGSKLAGKSKLLGISEIDLAPKSVKNIELKLEIGEDVPKNKFIEGFIYLDSIDGKNSDISIPYLGFYGNWDSFKNIDEPIFTGESIINETTLVSMNQGIFGSEVFYIGSGKDGNPGHFAINPDGEYSIKNVLPQVTILRNLDQLSIDITDENGKLIREITRQDKLRKDVFVEKAFKGQVDEAWMWDGKIFDKDKGVLVPAKDGQYYLNLESKIDFPGAKEQTVSFPVKIDTIAPDFSMDKVVFVDSKDAELEMIAKDEGSGVGGFVFIIDDKEYKTEEGNTIFNLKEEDGKYKVSLKLPEGNKPVYNGHFACIDYARNMSYENIVIVDKNYSSLELKLDKDKLIKGEDFKISVNTNRDFDHYEIILNGDIGNPIKTKDDMITIDGSLLRDKNYILVKALDKKNNIVDANALEFEAISADKEIKEVDIEDLTEKEYFYKGDEALIRIKAANNEKDLKEVSLIVNLIDERGNLVDFSSVSDLLNKEEEKILETSVLIPDEGKFNIEVMVWDNFENQMPYRDSIRKLVN